MHGSNPFSFGIEIGVASIKCVLLDSVGLVIIAEEIDSPSPLMPGATTIALCQLIESMDPSHDSHYVGVAFDSKMDINDRSIKASNTIPEWLNIPFADWLEARLHRSVVLFTFRICETLRVSFPQSDDSHVSNTMPIAFGAALLALEHFKI